MPDTRTRGDVGYIEGGPSGPGSVSWDHEASLQPSALGVGNGSRYYVHAATSSPKQATTVDFDPSASSSSRRLPSGTPPGRTPGVDNVKVVGSSSCVPTRTTGTPRYIRGCLTSPCTGMRNLEISFEMYTLIEFTWSLPCSHSSTLLSLQCQHPGEITFFSVHLPLLSHSTYSSHTHQESRSRPGPQPMERLLRRPAALGPQHEPLFPRVFLPAGRRKHRDK